MDEAFPPPATKEPLGFESREARPLLVRVLAPGISGYSAGRMSINSAHVVSALCGLKTRCVPALKRQISSSVFVQRLVARAKKTERAARQ
jgi:hypothetical protein